MKINRGFTLIELLVVIAIIAILSSIVIASLGRARNKSKDAALMQTMTQAQTQAFLYFDEFNGYIRYSGSTPIDTVCGFATLNVFEQKFFELAVTGIGDCAQDNETFAMEALLTDGTWFCVDSNGYRGESNPGNAPNFDEVRPVPPDAPQYFPKPGPYKCVPA